MQVLWRLMNVLGLAMLVLVGGAMKYDPLVEPAQVSAPPAIDIQVLERLG